MYIKHLIGARKGEIEDLPFEVAKQKVEAAEAEDVYSQLPRMTTIPVEATIPVEPQPVSAAVMQPEVVSSRADAVTIGANVAKKKMVRR
jgi:hypothetical protein